jgi:hypothetical protein
MEESESKPKISLSKRRWPTVHTMIWTCISILLVIFASYLYYGVTQYDAASPHNSGGPGYEGEGALGGLAIVWMFALAVFGFAVITSLVGAILGLRATVAHRMKSALVYSLTALNVIVLIVAVTIILKELLPFFLRNGK